MPNRERILRGQQFEHRVRDVLGARLVSRSGAGWRDKGDVKGGGMRVSCKAEADRTWGRTREQFREAIEMAFGTGEVPMLAMLEDDGEEFVLMRLPDLARVLSLGGNGRMVGISRGQRLGEMLDTPAILRETDAP
jgi:hypothetical protein